MTIFEKRVLMVFFNRGTTIFPGHWLRQNGFIYFPKAKLDQKTSKAKEFYLQRKEVRWSTY